MKTLNEAIIATAQSLVALDVTTASVRQAAVALQSVYDAQHLALIERHLHKHIKKARRLLLADVQVVTESDFAHLVTRARS